MMTISASQAGARIDHPGSNRTDVTYTDGRIIGYSYSTPVVAIVPGVGIFVTKQHYSVTTSKHVNQFVKRHGAQMQYKTTSVSQDFINLVVELRAWPDSPQTLETEV